VSIVSVEDSLLLLVFLLPSSVHHSSLKRIDKETRKPGNGGSWILGFLIEFSRRHDRPTNADPS
jgi:hypothetical protein